MNVSIIGIDCATENARIGLARGQIKDSIVTLDEACLCSRANPAIDILVQWLSRRVGPILLAIDAPLG